MANVNSPFGFADGRPMNGACDGEIESFTIATGLSANIGYDDFVKMTGTGRNITVAAAGDTTIIGRFKGVRYIDANGAPVSRKNWPTGTTGTNIEALVDTNTNQELICQADSCAEGDVGATCDIVVGTPNAFGHSTSYAEGSSTATSGKTLLILGLAPLPENAYGKYAKIRVKRVEGLLLGTAAGV